MANILEFAPQDMLGLHGQVRVLAFQRLDTCQLIQADHAFPLCGPLGGARIQLTPLDNFLLAPLVRHRGQPVAEAVRLQAPFFSSRAACRGEICWTIPRLITSSAISRPVH